MAIIRHVKMREREKNFPVLYGKFFPLYPKLSWYGDNFFFFAKNKKKVDYFIQMKKNLAKTIVAMTIINCTKNY